MECFRSMQQRAQPQESDRPISRNTITKTAIPLFSHRSLRIPIKESANEHCTLDSIEFVRDNMATTGFAFDDTDERCTKTVRALKAKKEGKEKKRKTVASRSHDDAAVSRERESG
ncbi:uncharacterized protein UTRI_06164 [Ustilago trichophora]|uniref:Uncharacterized protein n=1 Tax=Ustilago trichophora TaxID=86804 RepID=A0A5C3EGM2_9BASI|nr:uncharacterized protein UTRI_06164 [Ustilago trichophora]